MHIHQPHFSLISRCGATSVALTPPLSRVSYANERGYHRYARIWNATPHHHLHLTPSHLIQFPLIYSSPDSPGAPGLALPRSTRHFFLHILNPGLFFSFPSFYACRVLASRLFFPCCSARKLPVKESLSSVCFFQSPPFPTSLTTHNHLLLLASTACTMSLDLEKHLVFVSFF